MFERRTESKSASSVFYEEFNDVDIYIEDQALGYKKIFKELINKALKEQFKIEQIFPLGNRDTVIKACSNDQVKTDRRKVYIVDGDFFLLNNDEAIDLNALFVLPRYCIENYLIDEKAIVKTSYLEDPNLEEDEIIQKLQFNAWKDENQRLVELFVIYGLCFKFLKSEQTVGHKVTKLCASNSGVICQTKLSARVADLRNKLLTVVDKESLDKKIDEMQNRLKGNKNALLTYVSGKDYLFPLITTRLQLFSKFSGNDLRVKLNLALHCDVSELEEIINYFY